MLTDQLPKQVDPRKLASKGVDLDLRVPVARLKRFAETLLDSDGEVEVHLHFGVDEQGVRYIKGRLDSLVTGQCNRCLEPMKIALQSSINLGVIWEDSQACSLPKEYDPLIVGEDPLELIILLEEELLLVMPYVNYHEPEECSGRQNYSSLDDGQGGQQSGQSAGNAEQAEQKTNPFSVLEILKSGKE